MHELNVLLKIEFKRLFKNKLFYISLFIGVVLATGSFINKVIPHMDILNGFDGSVASYPFSVFLLIQICTVPWIIHGWEFLLVLIHLQQHMYMCVCYSVHCHTVVIFQGIITTSTYCSIIAEHRGIRCMQPDSLQHLFREECLSFCLY